MRRSTVRNGLNLIIAAVVLVIIGAFYHEQFAQLLSLSSASETRFIFLCLLWGGVAGCAGISVAVFGLLRSPGGGPARVNLVKPLVILVLLVLMFVFLVYSSFTRPETPRLRPGETITI